MALSPAELYALVLSALNYLQDDGGQFRKGAEKAGLTREEFWLLTRFRYFPGTVTPGDFLTFGPYTSLATYEQQLESLVAKKFAEAVEIDRYRSAEAGRKLVDQLYRDYFAAIARHDRLIGPETVLMLDSAIEEICNRREADMRMRPHIETSACEELTRPHLIEEDERPDHLPLPRGQGAPDLEAADVMGPGQDDAVARLASGWSEAVETQDAGA